MLNQIDSKAADGDDHQHGNEKEMNQVVHPGKGVNGGGSDILRQSPSSSSDASSLLDKPFVFPFSKTLIWDITTLLLIPMFLYIYLFLWPGRTLMM